MIGYISHDPVKFKEALTEFKELVCKEFGYDKMRTQIIMDAPYLGNIGYYLTDNDKKCIDDLYFRFSCTSPETLQEFSQPYYASHLDDAYNDIEQNKRYLNN